MNTLQETGPFRLRFAKPRPPAPIWPYTRRSLRITQFATQFALQKTVQTVEFQYVQQQNSQEVALPPEQAPEQLEQEHRPLRNFHCLIAGQPVEKEEKSVGTSRKASVCGKASGKTSHNTGYNTVMLTDCP